MKPLPTEEKKRKLSLAFWDLKVNPDLLLNLLDGDIREAEGIEKKDLYRRLLGTYDWYTLLKIVPREKLSQMLDDSVLDGLFPKDLKEKYLYARKLLRG